MSRTPYFFIEAFNSFTNKYELEHPYIWNQDHTDQELADLFPYNGCHDLFSIVEDTSDYPAMYGIHSGLPKDVCNIILNSFAGCCTENHKPKARWFTYADLYIYILEHPEILVDEETKETISNPMIILKERIDAFLEITHEWGWRDDQSQIRIVYWIE